jgi:hypothetical protein
VLLVPKKSIFQHWPEPSATSAASESGKAGPTTKAKRHSHAEIEVLQAFDRLLARINLKDLKNMSQKERARAVENECGEKFDDRLVDKHFQSWLEKHRSDV